MLIMGCHTWSYKKAKNLSKSEKDRIYNNAVKTAENWWGFKYTTDELIDEVKNWYERQPELYEGCGDPESYAINMLHEFTDKRDKLIEGGFDYWLKTTSNNYPVCFVHKGEKYINIGFDDPFRVYCYPDVGFIESKEDLFKFLQGLDSGSYGYYKKIDGENKFISGFTDELVSIIDSYYEKHGGDIMFDFG